MEKQFVTYEIALKLKELGFDEECFGYFAPLKKELTIWHNPEVTNQGEFILAPLWQQAIDWLREEHRIDIQILRNKPGYHEYKVEIYKTKRDINVYTYFTILEDNSIKWFQLYSEAREEGILEGIKLIEVK